MSFTPKCKTARQDDWWYRVVWQDDQTGEIIEETVRVPAGNCSAMVIIRKLGLPEDTELLKQRLA